jgi:starch-binding outer membrane protein, SusD/RagB family
MTRFLRKKILIIASGFALLAGCDNFLSESPDNRVNLDTPEKAAQLLTNAYTNAGYNFTEWMSDDVSYTRGTQKLTEHNQLYSWQDVTSVNQDTPTNFWTSTYDAISHANEVLAIIDDMTGDRKQLTAVKGEAFLTRAYGHFMLVNLFAKHYNSETADTDLGIPYVLEPETVFIKKYTRNTVKEVYDLVEDDLKNGLKYVNDSYYANSGKYHFTKNAALAFASRFYLFKGDFDNCVKYSSQMLGTDPGSFLKDIEALLIQKANPEDFIQLFTSPSDQSNILLMRNITNFPVSVGYWPDIGLLRNLYSNNPFDADDVRISNEYPIFVRGTNGLAFGKFEFLFERSSLTSNVGLYYTIFPAFRGEEVLLNRAESYIYQNQMSLALADLQVYISKRYGANTILTLQKLKTYYNQTNGQIAALSFTIDERQKEFMHEGLRWFDIKRYGIKVTHYESTGISNVLDNDDDRKVLQIPQAAIDVGGLEPNPR